MKTQRSVSSEEWKKPRFFSGLLKNNRKPRFVSGSLEKVELRFVNTSLVSQVDSDKQKKPKILLVDFQKIKIRKYIRIHE
ncbi:unnamed protein product [Rhizophagus irregularis]|nr:unnamed protein product [Rhizophagus irregularis]